MILNAVCEFGYIYYIATKSVVVKSFKCYDLEDSVIYRKVHSKQNDISLGASVQKILPIHC